ncbi:MAG: hypothetical protein CMJ40_03270 [Phycisphaerae bacterium]|nr:hypothetical protein [Phycisphaerae bacterium]|tara:strand:+ start:5403 stop:7097 length:1695 start_codon:yes stop_codon:yes gene_type:complete
MSRLLAIFLLIFLIIYLIPLGARPIVTPDEARYGAIPAEMIATGEWVAPRLNGIRYFEKPVLGYWAIAASQKIFGANAWAIRLPSALAIGFSALCLVLISRRCGLPRGAGWYSALACLTMLGMVITGTTSLLDGMFTGALVGALTFFYMAWTATTRSSRIGWLVLFGGFCGLSFLIKGFLGLAVPTMVIAPFLIWMGKWRDFFTMPWIPMLVAGIVVMPWALAVHLADSDYWHYFFWVEHIHRFTGGEEAQHPEPFWFFAPILLVILLPWTFALPLAIEGLLRKHRLHEPWIRYALCWLFIPVVFFSISSGKLPTYIIPCVPAAALLIAVGVLERFRYRPEKPSFKWIYPSIILFAIGLVCILEWAFGLIGMLPWSENWKTPWGEDGTWRFLAMGLACIAWGVMDLLTIRVQRADARVLMMALSPVVMSALLPSFLPTAWLGGYKTPEIFISKHDEVLSNPETLVISDSNLMHSVNWFNHRYDVILFGGPGEMAWGIADHADRQVVWPEMMVMVANESRHRPVAILLRDTELLQRFVDEGDVPEPIELDLGNEIGLAVFGPSER